MTLLRFALDRKPLESGLFWSLAASLLAMRAGNAAPARGAYLLTAVLVLVVCLVETSYRMAYHDELTGLPGRRAFNDAWYRGDTARAFARLDSVLRITPINARTEQWVPQAIANLYSLAGAPARARAVLKQWDASMSDTAMRRRTQRSRLDMEAEIALAEKRSSDAIALFRRADLEGDGLPSGCNFCLPVDLGRSYDAANMPDSAIAYLERYVATPSAGRINIDAWFLPAAHKRLGELYEARGDNVRAVAHSGAFVELWKRADPDLQPKVASVRARLERLRKTLPD
jgi:hypothetical protein